MNVHRFVPCYLKAEGWIGASCNSPLLLFKTLPQIEKWVIIPIGFYVPFMSGESKTMRLMRKLIIPFAISVILLANTPLSLGATAQGAAHVNVLAVKGAINPATADYIARGVEAAEEEGATCLVIQLDTPGGLDSSMRDIVQGIINAGVPIVVYVSPQGARAASAGVFIALAAHVMAMAPNTSIGAAHPVGIPLPGAGEPAGMETLMEKATNDAVAYIKSIAAQRERNAEWAESAVRDNAAATEQEAVELGVVDLVAKDLDDLLAKLEGWQVEIAGEGVALHTEGATINRIPMTSVERVLHTITEPNIAYILLIVGINGLIIELSAPGASISGIVGGISLLLGFYALGMLPVNYAGLLLILFGLLLFILDVRVPGYGFLAIGGITSFLLGSLILFNTPFYAISRSLIVSLTLATGLFLAFIVRSALQAQRRRVTTGREGLIGEVAIARTALDPEGMVSLHGELWDAVAEGERIDGRERVRVVAMEDFKLKVEKADEL